MSSKNALICTAMLIFLLLFFAKPALGLSEDFNAYASKRTIRVCACSMAQSTLTLENTGEVTSTYRLVQGGHAANFSTLTENLFSLEPGQTKRVYEYVNVPCEAEGDHELITNINTLFDLTSQLRQTVKVQRCVNVQITALNYLQRACPCSPASYDFRITNTGSFLETYRLSVPEYGDWVDISEQVLVLEPSQSEIVHLFVNLPCDMYGDYELKLAALAENSQMQGELTFKLEIEPCYDYSISSQDQVSVCQKLPGQIPLTINNEADVANVFELSTSQQWATFENASMFLWPKQQGDVNLILSPLTLEPGQHNLTIHSLSARGEVEVTKDITVNVENCYGLELGFMPDQSLVVQCESNRLDFYVRNNGSRQGTFELTLEGPEWVSLLNEPLMSILPGQERQGILEAVVPCEGLEDEYQLMLTAALQDHPEVAFAATTPLIPVPVEQAYAVEITSLDELRVDYAITSIPIYFENTGIKEITYLISMNGSDWMALDKNTITLMPGEVGTINLTTSPTNETPEGKYALAISAQPEAKNLLYSRQFVIELREKGFFEKLAEHWYWLLLPLALIAIAVIGAVLLARKKEKKEKPELLKKVYTEEKGKKKASHLWWVIPLVVLLLAALIGGVYLLAGKPAEEVLNQTALEKATIYVNRTGLEGRGNEIIIREQVTIPLIIRNNDVTNTYHIDVQEDVDWITVSEQELQIAAGQSKTVYLYVSPTNQTEEGQYKITIDITIEDTAEKISEEIELRVKRKESWLESYWPYLLAGAALAGLAVLAHWLFSRKKRERPVPKEALPKITSKEIKKKRGSDILKKALLALLLVLILAAIVGGAFFLVKSIQLPQTQNITEPEEGTAYKNISESTIYVNKTGLEGRGNEIIIRQNVTIPLIIQNNAVANTYHIEVQEDVDWITVSEQELQIAAGQSETVYLLVAPTNQTEEGQYKITIDVTIEDTPTTISEELMLDVKPHKSFGEKFAGYLFYIILGLIIAGIAVAAAHLSEKRAKMPKRLRKPEVVTTKTDLKLR